MKTHKPGKSNPTHFSRMRVCLVMAGVLGGIQSGWGAQPGQTLPAGTIPQYQGPKPAAVKDAVDTATGKLLVIDQATQRAIYNWSSFNIARGSEVRFNQPNAGSSALNRIFDADPTLIQGALSANGQVILLNQNGILFDRGSQVNVRSLIASTLNITDDVFMSGVRHEGDSAALLFEGVTGFTRIDIGSYGPADAPAAMLTASQGGNIIILAPDIVNNGIIRSPDGQVILAAGHKVLLYQPPAQNSAQIRGYFVQVSANKDPLNLTSLVTNLGNISADRGNVTLAGLAINQMGRVSAKTAVNRNGSIWLIGQDKVVLGAQSLTETPLDLADSTTLAEDQEYDKYRASVKVEANTIIHQGRITSPSGVVSLATLGAADLDPGGNSAMIALGDAANSGPTRIFLDNGSVIDVSGSWADVPIEKNLITLPITSNDLKDSPVQKGGVLLGKRVTVDARQGTSLLDISGYAGAIPRAIAEKAALGGDISLISQGDVILQNGSLLDISGGGYRYASGSVNTTSLLGADGKFYDIGSAPKDIQYVAAFKDEYVRFRPKWGVTETFSALLGLSRRSEPGYVEGKAAGSITLDGQSIVQDGSLRARVTIGRNQVAAGKQPALGTLNFGVPVPNRPLRYLLNEVMFTSRNENLPADFSPASLLPDERVGKLSLPVETLASKVFATDTQFVQEGFGSITIGANERIELPEGVVLNLAAGAKLAMSASEIEVGGIINAPGGTVLLNALNTGADRPILVSLSSHAAISTAGAWINDRLALSANQGQVLTPIYVQGGKITLTSDYAIDLAAGSQLNVSGGAQLTQAGRIVAADAGSITLQAGVLDGRLTLGGELLAYSAAKGGALSLRTGEIVIGGPAVRDGSLALNPEFFQRGGFAQYDLKSYYGITLKSGTHLEPSVQNLFIDIGVAATQRSGTDLLSFARREDRPAWQFAPVNLAFTVSASQLEAGAALNLEKDSVIKLQPGGAFTATSFAALNVFGTIEAPGGSIVLTQKSDQPGTPALRLGESSRLLTRGVFVATPNDRELRTGSLYRGGNVTLDAAGEIVTEAGSIIDVSAVSASMDIATSSDVLGGMVTTLVNGNAGVVTMTSKGAMKLDGTLLGHAAEGAAGGSLVIDLQGASTSGSLQKLIVRGPGAAGGVPQPGITATEFDVARWTQSGFDKLNLSSLGQIEFAGDVTLAAARSIDLSASVLNVASGNAVISATRVGIDGQSLDPNNVLNLIQFETTPGSATMRVDAGLIELNGGITINGISKLSLRSRGDLRMTGLPVQTGTPAIADSLKGYLVTPGNLEIAAQQTYPTTFSEFRMAVAEVKRVNGSLVETPVIDGRIDVLPVTGTPGAVLSAGGALALSADHIVNGGVLKAPLGRIDLRGATSVTLTSDSLASVSGAGLTIPFGSTVNGKTWNYGPIQNASLAAKSIDVDAPNVVIPSGARLDVSGGGDVQAVEWIPGIGGSSDVLLGSDTYAILPSMRLGFAPWDSELLAKKELPFTTTSGIYDAVYFPGGGGIEAGYYPLLPGYYAMLPGAYKVSLRTGASYSNILPGTGFVLTGGGHLMAGKFAVAGTNVQAQTWSAFAVEPAVVVARQSEYRLSNASFFSNQAATNDRVSPPLPRDAGRVSISAATHLEFAPLLLGSPGAGGNIASVDISAPRITVVSSTGAPAGGGGVQLDAATLSALNASLLLGGTRSQTSDGVTLLVAAQNVTVVPGAELRGPEIMLAATDTVEVQDGAIMSGEGAFSGVAQDLLLSAGGSALLRVSSGNQINVARSGSIDRTRGTIVTQEGAVVSATKSMLLDATRNTQARGTLSLLAGGHLNLGAANIRLGSAPASEGSLLVNNALLSAIRGLSTVTLHSYGSIDFHGDIALGSEELGGIVLDSAAINGLGGGSVDIQARNVALRNSASTVTAASTGTGRLEVVAEQVELGVGSKALSGFSEVAIKAKGEISGTGKGELRVAGDLTLESVRVTGASKSDQTIIAVDDSKGTKSYYNVTTQRPEFPLAATGIQVLGAKLAITASSIHHGGTIELLAGGVTLTGAGAGGIELLDGSILSVAGAAKSFGDAQAYANGGTLKLVTVGGLNADVNSVVNVSGSAAGGDAGTLAITMQDANGSVKLNGTLRGAALSGYRQGVAVLDLVTAGNFSVLNASLNLAGFTQARDIRIRNGDLVLNGENSNQGLPADRVVAREITLATDNGSIDVFGIVDASGPQGGGKVRMYASQDIEVGDGAVIRAQGTSNDNVPAAAYSHGGEVELSARDGNINFADGALIDVSAAAQGKSNGGNVLFSARRTVNSEGRDSGVAMNLTGTINVGGAGQPGTVTLEGLRTYDLAVNAQGVADTAVASAPGSIQAADYMDFTQAAPSILEGVLAPAVGGGLRMLGASASTALQVSGGIELRSAGDMQLTSAWDLTSATWMPAAQPGRLTLRSSGNLTIKDALGFPNDNLATARSWSMQLISGADLAAANSMATSHQGTRGASGDVILTNEVRGGVSVAGKVRTGTGSIRVAAARDIVFQDPPGAVPTANGSVILTAPATVIYTAGLPRTGAGNQDLYPAGGGDIELAAGWNIQGAAKQQQYVNDWLRRTTSNVSEGTITANPASWWVRRLTFRHNSGALGGGDISVSAGNNVTDFSAMLPTTGRLISGAGTVTMDVQGGGDLRLRAGGNLDGGEFLVSRGNGSIEAAGSVGGSKAASIFLMGQSSDPALDGAAMRVSAGGNLNIQNVSNPTLLVLSSMPTQIVFGAGFGTNRSAFITYSERSRVELQSVAGDIVFQGKMLSKLSRVPVQAALPTALSDFLPPSVSMTALQGAVKGSHDLPNASPLLLYPSPTSRLSILADANISNMAYQVTDAVPLIQTRWGWDKPAVSGNEAALDAGNYALGASASLRYVAPGVAGRRDFQVSSNASILDSTFTFPREAVVFAKADLRNVRLDLQNLDDDEVSIVRAGRDILYTDAYQNGVLDAEFLGGYIRIGGPGRLLVQSGRHIDLGASEGINSLGNNSNTSLTTSRSANLTMMAGVTKPIEFGAIDTLFAELKSAGLKQDAAAGEAAVNRVFNSQNTAPGSITMYLSQVRTQGDSGIDLLAPSGDINAGLPVSPAGKIVGISTTFGGDIRSYLSGDFNVNQSKVLTLIGGDIFMYTSDGNIDAGRGARDSRTTQAPKRVAILDDKGQPTGLFTFVPPVDASGSGIRSLTFDPDGPGPLATPAPGSIYLFAPKGFIDAGEAGVSSAGNIFVAALQVLNASNFSAAGSSVGVPPSSSGGLSAGLSGASSVGASAAKSADAASRTLAGSAAAQGPKDIVRPSMITVELLGLGDDSCKDKQGCGEDVKGK
jgi:filamentous hemagglutinin